MSHRCHTTQGRARNRAWTAVVLSAHSNLEIWCENWIRNWIVRLMDNHIEFSIFCYDNSIQTTTHEFQTAPEHRTPKRFPNILLHTHIWHSTHEESNEYGICYSIAMAYENQSMDIREYHTTVAPPHRSITSSHRWQVTCDKSSTTPQTRPNSQKNPKCNLFAEFKTEIDRDASHPMVPMQWCKNMQRFKIWSLTPLTPSPPRDPTLGRFSVVWPIEWTGPVNS